MEFNLFTVCSAFSLLLPAGMALAVTTHEPLRCVLARLVTAVVAGGLTFALVGCGILQGEPDILMSIDASRTLFRGFDGAAFHHLMLATVGTGLVGVTLRGHKHAAIAVAAIVLGGFLFPSAAKLVWFGPLRRAGLIDIGGATALLALAASFAVTLFKLTSDRVRLETESESLLIPSVGGVLTIVGWCAVLYTTGVMQSPSTCTLGAMNGLRAAAAAGLVAAIVIRARRLEEGPLRVFAAVTAGVASTTALAGRAPAASVIVLGAVAGVLAPAVVLAVRRLLGRGTALDHALAIWLGSLVACLLAVPYAGDPDAMHIQLLVQSAGFVMCSGLGICAAILLSPIIRILSTGERADGQPIAANGSESPNL